MKYNRLSTSVRACLLAILLPFSAHTSTAPSAPQGVYSVTTTAGRGPGSLRRAIHASNASPGVDVITFNIPRQEAHTIRPVRRLPTITDPVIIDGYSQPGASANTLSDGDDARLLIELDGSRCNRCYAALRLAAGNSLVRGLVINRFPAEGLVLEAPGGDTVEGNFLGTDPTGTVDLGNHWDGVAIIDSGNNVLGGLTNAARNLISGNHEFGIRLVSKYGGGNMIQGNYIGTDHSGTAKLGNHWNGVFVQAFKNTIGGTTSAARNIISGNGTPGSTRGSGIQIQGPDIYGLGRDNVVQGNYIGTDRSGTHALGNAQHGVWISEGVHNTIGGTTPGAGNVISGNALDGINIYWGGLLTSSNLVQGNLIGLSADSRLALPNGRDGIAIRRSADGNTIGGTSPGEGNTIAHNRGAGVHILSGTENAIRQNLIFGNRQLGINLGRDGVTPNDDGDPPDLDQGPNQLQNFPVLRSARSNSLGIGIDGSLDSMPNTTFTLEFFSNVKCDASGHGEGMEFIGSTDVTTSGNGNVIFGRTFAVNIPAGRFISATATDPGGNTSEFSNCVLVMS